ncbi:MAG: histidine phosphatase family protein [bacterium]
MGLESVILVRHAQSEHHINGLTGGWTDTPITELGHRQAELVAKRLRAELAGVEVRLVTSDFRRAHDTARHIASEFNIEATLDPRLREFGNGVAAWMNAAEARTRFPEPSGPWHPDYRHWPEGETWRDVHTRAGQFLESLSFDGALPIVVSHGGTIDALIACWLRLSAEAFAGVGFAAHVTSITVLQQDEHGSRRVERVNDTAHLNGTEGHISLSQALRD